MATLTESIRAEGILSPLIVRPIDGTEEYEIISGHRRLYAAQKAGLSNVPAFVYEMNREEAAILLVDSNLHREHILPSEKAFAYKLKMEAMSRQGQRTDLTSDQVEPKLTAAAIAEGESVSQVKRYIRLTHLTPGILNLVDNGRISLTPAVEISYLNRQEQDNLLYTMESEDCTPSLAQSKELRANLRRGFWTWTAFSIFCPSPSLTSERISRFPWRSFESFSPSATPSSKLKTPLCRPFKKRFDAGPDRSGECAKVLYRTGATTGI